MGTEALDRNLCEYREADRLSYVRHRTPDDVRNDGLRSAPAARSGATTRTVRPVVPAAVLAAGSSSTDLYKPEAAIAPPGVERVPNEAHLLLLLVGQWLIS